MIPTTHLELTMIHEVMVLDHSGPDFAFIQYGAALKALGAGLPDCGHSCCRLAAVPGSLMLAPLCRRHVVLGTTVGLIESGMARLRLLRVPQLLVAAGALSVFAFMLVVR